MKWCLPYNQWNGFNKTIVIFGIFVIQTQKVILKKTTIWKYMLLEANGIEYSISELVYKIRYVWHEEKRIL